MRKRTDHRQPKVSGFERWTFNVGSWTFTPAAASQLLRRLGILHDPEITDGA